MAETRTERETNRGQEERQGRAQERRDDQRLSRQNQGPMARRWDPSFGAFTSPFELMNRMSEEMDRLFEQLARGSGMVRPSSGRMFGSSLREGMWRPRMETFQKGDTYYVRAELPGVKKDDVEVELTDEAITIRGERREEQQEEREGYWRTEREYGQFLRTVPLPEGVIGESAQATFRDGVLEISIKAAPSAANQGRRLEITEGSAVEQNR